MAPGDPDRHVEIRRDHLARLAYLPVVGGVARIHRRPRGAHGGTERVGQRLDQFVKLVRRAEGAATETMIRAEASSGRSDLAISSPLNVEPPASGVAADTSSIGATPPPSAAAAKAAVRTVITRFPLGACTVWIAFPA